MKKVVGYVLAVAGLVVMVFGFGSFDIKIGFLEGVASSYVAGVGVVMVIAGVVITMMNRGARQKVSEVPIYEGKGKARKVVGYQRD